MNFVLPAEAEELLTPAEIDEWCELLDEIEQEPLFLHWLEQNNPGILEEFRGIMRNVHALAAQKMWRLADGTPGTARPAQLMPGTPGSASDRTDWRVWLLLAGRGSGKSFAAAQAVRELLIGREWQRPPRFALVSSTLEAVRLDMIEGALLPVLGPLVRKYNRSSLEIFLENGAHLKGYSSERPGRLRGPNFVGAWCLEREAPVLMADGSQREIGSIRPGDMVATRSGPRRVKWAGLTRRRAEVWGLPLSDGTVLRATADHPVWVCGAGWVRLSDIRPGDTLIACSSLGRRPGWNTQASGGIATATATTRINSADYCIGGSTRTTSDRSRMGSWSTTRMAIEGTLTPPTWKPSLVAITSGTTAPSRQGAWSPPTQRNGEGGSTHSGPSDSQSSGSASSAVSLTNRRPPIPAGARSSVRGEPGGTLTCVAAASPLRTADVYDLTVEGAHEFFAHGVLVHNCDEIASWLDADHAPSEDSTWSNLEFATRADDNGTWEPRIIATTTPKPVRLLRIIDKHDDFYPGLVDDPNVVVTKMRTYDNLGNLAQGFAKRITSRYEGTRLAAQELDGELLDQIEGALWTIDTINLMRSDLSILNGPVGGYKRVVVSVDPTMGDGSVSNDECGIIVGCIGEDDRVWILDDCTVKGPPSKWCQAVGEAFQRWEAGSVLVEVNQGGTLVKETLNRYWSGLPIRTVRAKDGKRIRAEGPALLCEQGEVKLACSDGRKFPLLTDQLMTWDPLDKDAPSPDRLDAFVQLILHLKPAVAKTVIDVDTKLYRNARGRQRRIRRPGGPNNPYARAKKRPVQHRRPF